MAINNGAKSLNDIDTESRALIRLLIFGIKKFYKQDAEALFGHGDCPKHIDERAMVGCIYRYMYQRHSKRCVRFPHVDIEYNRMMKLMEGMEDAEIKKEIDPCDTCDKTDDKQDCIARKDVFQKWMKELKSKKDSKGIRPDIVVHERNGSNNGLIVEFKKLKGDVSYDVQKVRYATCHSSPLHYIVGAVVRLHKNNAEVEMYQNGELKCEFLVARQGVASRPICGCP